MGLCHSQRKKNSELSMNNKRCKSTPKSFMSLQIPNYEAEIDNEQQPDKKRSSRLSNTRNSLIIAHKIAFSQIDNSYRQQSVSRIQQPIVILPFQLISQESKDTFFVTDESIQIQEVFSLSKNSNYLKQIAMSCIFLNFSNQNEIQQNEDELEEHFKMSVIPLENISVNLSNESPMYSSRNSRAILQKREKQQKSLQFVQNNSFQQFSSQRKIELTINSYQLKKLQFNLINTLCFEISSNVNQGYIQNEIIDTLQILMESMSFNVLNPYAIIWIMRKILEENGIQLILSKNQIEKSVSYQKQTSQKLNFLRSKKIVENILNFNQINILSCNMAKSYYEISFKDDQQYNFRQIFGCTSSKKTFLQQLESLIRESLYNLEDQSIYWIKASIQNLCDQLVICFYIPFILQSQNQRFMRQLEEKVTKVYNIKGVKCRELMQILNIQMNIFDAWGNREYKTNLNDQEEFKPVQDYFQYIRPVGWKQFGLLQQEVNSEKGKFVYGYMKLTITNNNIGSNDFFQRLYYALDIGPNNEQSPCGSGIIISQNIVHLLPTSQDSKIPMEFRLKPTRIIIQNDVHYYYVVLQVKIERKQIRIPENFGIQLFIVNNHQKVINEGILVKELNEMEYNESMKLMSN